MPRRKFDHAFKLSTVQLVRQSGYSPAQADHSLGVSTSHVNGWIKPLGGLPEAGPVGDGAVASELRRLREENARLKVVGHAQADHMRAELCVEALGLATRKRGRHPGLILHGDRGVQFASDEFRYACRQRGIAQSMSDRGDCHDNAVAESFFGRLKTEHLHGQHFATRDRAKLEVFAFIEGFYNPRRMHATLDYQSPDQFEQQHQTQAA